MNSFTENPLTASGRSGVPREDLSLVIGNETRYDDVDYSYKFARKFEEITAVLDDYTSRQLSTGFFAQAQYKPFEFLKLMGGLRYDYFDIDVDNKIKPEKSGTANPDVLSSKIGIFVTSSLSSRASCRVAR